MTKATISIPETLSVLSNGNRTLSVQAGTVGTAMEELKRDYPDLSERLLTPDGQVRNFVNIYLGEDNVRVLEGTETPLRHGDTLLVVMAIAGG